MRLMIPFCVSLFLADGWGWRTFYSIRGYDPCDSAFQTKFLIERKYLMIKAVIYPGTFKTGSALIIIRRLFKFKNPGQYIRLILDWSSEQTENAEPENKIYHYSLRAHISFSYPRKFCLSVPGPNLPFQALFRNWMPALRYDKSMLQSCPCQDMGCIHL